jgi:hypothetical protein
MSGEAKSRSNIGLPGVQEDLLKELQKTGKTHSGINQCRSSTRIQLDSR